MINPSLWITSYLHSMIPRRSPRGRASQFSGRQRQGSGRWFTQIGN